MTRSIHTLLLLLSALLAATPVSAASAGEPLTAPTAMGLVTLDTDTPDAAAAIGTRHLPWNAKAPNGPTEQRFEMSSTVFVRTDSVEAVEALLREKAPGDENGATRLSAALPAGVSVERFEAVEGFVVVHAPSVREAARLATGLWASGRFGSVEMSAMPEKVLRGPIGDLLPGQWHLNNAIEPGHDINAQAAWDLGYSGLGINVGVIEFSIQYPKPFDPKTRYHPDLEANMNPKIATADSFYASDHATAVAGIIAADGENTEGGTGIAYNAGIATQIYGDEETTAAAFTHKMGVTHIKNCSWGPEDSGIYYYLTDILSAALEQTGTIGRGQRGGIFTWAGGNGGGGGALNADRADYDPWIGSRFVIGIGAITDEDVAAPYTERSSNIFMVAPSSGGTRGVTTTDRTGADGYGAGDYISSFGGTSAAAPVAAGAIALMLEANPELTRRDVMHVMADTARRNDPTDATWVLNGGGHWVSDKYGFGAIDAGAMCAAAPDHRPVGPESSFTTGRINFGATLPDNDPAGMSFEIPMRAGLTIESVELVVNATSTFIGDVAITLTSPDGTPSPLATTRGVAGDGLDDFAFKSYRSWGEDSGGTWTLFLADRGIADLTTLNSLELRVYGTRCTADTNLDTVLDLGDIQAFIAGFLTFDPYADFNGDGLIDSGDIQAFVNAFLAGCE